MNRPKIIFKAMKMLEEIGLMITEVKASKEFVEDAKRCREMIDKVGLEGLWKGGIDTEFDIWCDASKYGNIKTKKGEVGRIFGIRILERPK